jgi:NAD(P)-dependent dehydrogenase (short-subunit alcohol dehydrogenase family)
MGPVEQHDFTDKVVLITGGTRGLGEAMATGFATAGATVAVASRKPDACAAAVVRLRELGGHATGHPMNVGRWEDCTNLVADVYSEHDRIDVLINNAGLSPLAPSSVETSEELWDKVLAVNLKGPFRLTSLVASRMVEEGCPGSVVNVSSIAAIRPQPHIAPYAAAKAGLNALTTAFAKEYGPTVRVNCIMAGPFLTDLSSSWSGSSEFARRRQTMALRRAGNPDEVVGAALYLSGPSASFTTGAVLTIDGGAS